MENTPRAIPAADYSQHSRQISDSQVLRTLRVPHRIWKQYMDACIRKCHNQQRAARSTFIKKIKIPIRMEVALLESIPPL